MFIMHGYPKLFGGPEFWKNVGQAMQHVGITFLPMAWGFLAAIAETIGGFLLLIGLLFRPATLALAFTMLIASLHHLNAGDGLMGSSHAIEVGVVFLGLAFLGPGKYSVDRN